MATVSTQPRVRIRSDDLFFAGLAAFALVVVLVGFARTYFLAGLFRAPLPNVLIHIHGAVFTLWIALLITQVSLVSARRVDLHRRLGQLGFALALFMIALGVLAASDRLAREGAHLPGDETLKDVRAFYAVGMLDILAFATFVYFGYRNRIRPSVHKRLMMFATLTLIEAGFDRWPVFNPYPLPLVNLVCYVPLVLVMLGYDAWSTGRIQRVTLVSSVFLLTIQQAAHLVGPTAPWQRLAAWVQLHMPSFS